MLFEGELRHWNDDKGFGFIRRDGGPDLFVHISAFAVGSRPQVGDRIVFEPAPPAKGERPRAVEAVVKGRAATPSSAPAYRPSAPARPAPTRSARSRPAPGPHRTSPAPAVPRRQERGTELRPLRWSFGLLLIALSTLLCVAGSIAFLPQSPLPALLYPLASLIAFILYGKDKYRAIRHQWRVPEASLHLVEALGGWPGAYIAQQTMRHKTVKLRYQMTFWAIVAAHVGFWGLWWWLPPAEFSALIESILATST